MKIKEKKVPKTLAKRKASRNGRLGKPLPIAAIRELYHGEWLAVHLTKVDRYDNPIAGVVVAHAKGIDDLLPQEEEYRLNNPEADLYTFLAGDYIPEGWAVVLNEKKSSRAHHCFSARIRLARFNWHEFSERIAFYRRDGYGHSYTARVEEILTP
jgi:hypothetical protein